MTENTINSTAPASGAYVPPPVRLVVSSPDSGSGAVTDKDKGKSTSTGTGVDVPPYVPPHKAKATRRPAPAPKVKKSAGTWGPSKTPQVPAAPFKELEEGSGSGSGSYSSSEDTELSGKTSGVWGPSKTPQPVAPIDDGCQASHDSHDAHGTYDSHDAHNSDPSLENMAYIWNEPAGSQERIDGSGHATHKSIYSLNLLPRRYPRNEPLDERGLGIHRQPVL